MNFSKLKFIIDETYDLKMVYLRIKREKKKLKKLTESMGIDFKAAKKIQKEKEGLKIAKKLVNEKYKTLLPYLKKTLKLYQTSWNEINDEFFKAVERITGYPLKYKIYYCVLSPFHRGLSKWGGNIIVRTWRENPYLMRKITAHEILISHIFNILEKDFKEENLSDKEKWALSEISAWAITGLEKRMFQFWPWISEKEKYPLNHNYPELIKLQKTLKSLYEKKQNFKEFLKESIKVMRKKFKKK